jgi:hypothetical protein
MPVNGSFRKRDQSIHTVPQFTGSSTERGTIETEEIPNDEVITSGFGLDHLSQFYFSNIGEFRTRI